MYCLLRGIPNRRIDSIILNLAADLNFIQHIDKHVKMYSGGNKRKLSTAIALVGNPAIVYLDEPTTGEFHSREASNRQYFFNFSNFVFKRHGSRCPKTTLGHDL